MPGDKVEDSDQMEAPWAEPVPPKRGAQKKAALDNKIFQATSERKLAAHSSLGFLKLTLGAQKSYIVASDPEPNMPGLLAEFTHSQVGDKHQVLMMSLLQTSAEQKLTRPQIKELRAKVLSKVSRCHGLLTIGGSEGVLPIGNLHV